MEKTLRTIVAKIAETSPDFPPTANLRDDLSVDSVRALELVFEVEREFSIKVPDGRYGEVRTFQDLVKLVDSLKAA
jgi:acyl carrier protein